MGVRYFDEGAGFLPKGRMRTTPWITAVIKSEGFRRGDISYIFCSQEYHLRINRQYLGHDYQTDVITFDYSELKDKKTVSGDIFIDPLTVREQAAQWNAAPEEELMRVMIHGVLHLCGYSDKTPAQQKKMRALEDKYLSEYIRENKQFPPFPPLM